MSMEIFENACLDAIFLDHIGNKKARKPHSAIIKFYRINIFFGKIVTDKQGGKMIASVREICFDRIMSAICQVDDTEFSSFSAYGKFPGFEIYIISIESSKF